MAKGRKLRSCRRVRGGGCLCHRGKRQVFAKKSHCR